MASESAKRGAERVTGIANVTYDQDAREAGDQEVQELFTQLQQQLSQQIPQLKQCLQKRL